MTPGALTTSAEEVIRLFAVTPHAKSELDRWSHRPGGDHVVRHVMAHTTRTVYKLTVEDVREVSARTQHALGDVDRHRAESVTSIVNWRPDFAVTHVLHHVLETRGRLFTFQELRDIAEHDPWTRSALWAPALAEIRRATEDGSPEGDAYAAMRWRIGNAYYSFLREMFVVATLRELGVDVRVHPLADALFRVDAWIGRTILSLYIGNPKFRKGARGRKVDVETLLKKYSQFFFHPVELDTPATFGQVYMPTKREIMRVVDDVRKIEILSEWPRES